MKSNVRKRVKSTLWSTLVRIVGPEAQPASANSPSNGPCKPQVSADGGLIHG